MRASLATAAMGPGWESIRFNVSSYMSLSLDGRASSVLLIDPASGQAFNASICSCAIRNLGVANVRTVDHIKANKNNGHPHALRLLGYRLHDFIGKSGGFLE